MLLSEFNKLSILNLRWLYKYSDETLSIWKFKLSQIESIKCFGCDTGSKTIPLDFIVSFNYENSGLNPEA